MNKRNTCNIAVVGAGPAGAMCAYELTSAGKEVLLFDHKAPWEKPCGGMLSHRVFEEFPVMMDYPYPRLEFFLFILIVFSAVASCKVQ